MGSFRSFETKTDHIILNKQEDAIDLDAYGCVVGISIEIHEDSEDSEMDFNIDSEPIVRINQGEDARQYGGYHVCEVPTHYAGSFAYKFVNNASKPKALLILTRLTGRFKTITFNHQPA
jgi:hypothetical protein